VRRLLPNKISISQLEAYRGWGQGEASSQMNARLIEYEFKSLSDSQYLLLMQDEKSQISMVSKYNLGNKIILSSDPEKVQIFIDNINFYLLYDQGVRLQSMVDRPSIRYPDITFYFRLRPRDYPSNPDRIWLDITLEYGGSSVYHRYDRYMARKMMFTLTHLLMQYKAEATGL
jgi:hypothetical protein